MEKLEYFEIFFSEINKVNVISDNDKQLCFDYFEVEMYAKNTIIEKAGEIHLYQNFVVSGYLRKFILNDEGIQVTTDFCSEPSFFSCYSSLMDKKISIENLEAITDCILLRIKRKDIDILFEQGKTIHQYTILLFQKIIEKQNQKSFDLANLSAKDRYAKFIKNHPKVIQNVPLQYIATFLGITPQSLSRIRNEMAYYKS
jgi:CRP/FNR family transcriptional regulator, anaerobic regulatory protein